jgi:SM-20-related protein
MDNLTEKIIDDISAQGFAVVDDLLAPEVISGIRKELQQLESMVGFKRASVGRGTESQIHEGFRGDYIHWITPAESGKFTRQYLEFIHTLQQELNRYCYLGLKEAEVLYAHYPEGTYYKRHLDRFNNQVGRKVSILLYLNDEWAAEDGGELVMFLKNEDGKEVTKRIRPLAGRFICFMSDEIEHEVLPSKRDRYSITGWLLDKEQQNYS